MYDLLHLVVLVIKHFIYCHLLPTKVFSVSFLNISFQMHIKMRRKECLILIAFSTSLWIVASFKEGAQCTQQ